MSDEYFTATNQLRFVVRSVSVPEVRMSTDGGHTITQQAHSRIERILQQRWQGSNGTSKWEDVPEELEASQEGKAG